jgi:TPR repeat protein
LGDCYIHGLGGKGCDEAAGLLLLRRSVDLGCPAAFDYLGRYYTDRNDWKKANQLFEHAAKLGYPSAISNLAYFYFQSDPNRAISLWQNAADLGHPGSMHNLGMCLANHPNPQISARAAILFQQAAALGITPSNSVGAKVF